MVSVPARREQVAFAAKRGLSQRRACTLIKVARSVLHYRSRLAAKDAPVVARMAELSAQYPRYGYRRITAELRRRGMLVNHKRVARMMREDARVHHVRVAEDHMRPRANRSTRVLRPLAVGSDHEQRVAENRLADRLEFRERSRFRGRVSC